MKKLFKRSLLVMVCSLVMMSCKQEKILTAGGKYIWELDSDGFFARLDSIFSHFKHGFRAPLTCLPCKVPIKDGWLFRQVCLRLILAAQPLRAKFIF